MLKDGVVATKGNGGLLSWAGGFSIVFRINKADENWAFKVWSADLVDMKTRYHHIKRHLNKVGLPYFEDFAYEEKGLFVDGVFIPTHRMKWVEGIKLDAYIEAHLDDPAQLLKIASKFKNMVTRFHEAEIAHGDLQHGNIIVKENGDLAVIDYDSMSVPNIEGMPDIIKGLGGYQHPRRLDNPKISAKLDYFSELIIYLSLVVYAERPDLWKEAPDWLLFSKEDLADPANCLLISELLESEHQLISFLTGKLVEYLQCDDISDLQPLETILSSPLRISKPILSSITDKF